MSTLRLLLPLTLLGSGACTGGLDKADPTIPPDRDSEASPIDADGDGYPADEDCIDTNPHFHPGAPELCDGVDNDCDGEVDESGQTVWYQDQDGDGYGTDEVSTASCDPPADHVDRGGDCDDNDQLLHPQATERCNGIDDDCDGVIDGGIAEPRLAHVDLDGDGFGIESRLMWVCAPGGPFAEVGGDCDEQDSSIHPGAVELCTSGVDEDCDGLIDADDPDCPDTEDCAGGGDEDGDGLVDCEDGDCAGSPACVQDCANTADTDGDGVGGCEDEDCWAVPGCATTTARLTSWGELWGRNGGRRFMHFPCEMDTTVRERRSGWHVNVRDVAGTVSFETVRGSAGTCSWGASSVAFDEDILVVRPSSGTMNTATWSSHGGDAIERRGFWLSADCPLTGSSFLPPRLGPSGTALREGSDFGDTGVPWYGTRRTAWGGGWVGSGNRCSSGAPMTGQWTHDTARGGTSFSPHRHASTVQPHMDGGTVRALLLLALLATSACDGRIPSGDGPSPQPWVPNGNDDDVGEGDLDGDGYIATDCDETDPLVNPGAAERCNGVDDDCDGVIPEDERDLDGDGWRVCVSEGGSDCDDEDPAVHPEAEEVCDFVDNNCRFGADEGFDTDWYIDADGDGYGNPDAHVESCEALEGYVHDRSDCDDTDASVHPDMDDPCDGIDNDCSGTVDDGEGYASDADGDGYGDPTRTRSCPGDGSVDNTDDCDDADASIHPDADELCDRVDQDCDGDIDERPIDGTLMYADPDGDDYGLASHAVRICVPPSSYGIYATEAGDCDELDADVNPGASEDCLSRADEDCDGLVGADDPDCALTEDCSSGSDEDGDGLVDCEDADCADSSACVEDCLAGGDTDGDGLVGCDDEDCWATPGCASTLARLHGRSRFTATVRESGTNTFVCRYETVAGESRTEWRAVAASLSGTVAVETVGGSLGTCTWSVAEARFTESWRAAGGNCATGTGSTSWWRWSGVAEPVLSRQSFHVSSGCLLQGSSFLPVAVGPWGSGFAAGQSPATAVGQPWYQASYSSAHLTWATYRGCTSGNHDGQWASRHRTMHSDYYGWSTLPSTPSFVVGP